MFLRLRIARRPRALCAPLPDGRPDTAVLRTPDGAELRGGFAAPAHAHLCEHAVDVVLNRGATDLQRAGNFLVGQALLDQAEDFHLPPSKQNRRELRVALRQHTYLIEERRRRA